jgi:alcohol dehydrogenase
MPGGPTVSGGAYGLADFLTQMVKAAGLEVKLESLGVGRDKLSDLAADAANQWTGSFNPRRVDQESLNQIYEQAF